MQNVSLVWDTAGNRGDLAVSGAGLQTGSALEAAVLVSLFTDRRAGPDDVLTDGSDDRRGWWGDSYSSDLIGSRMWLLLRSKATTETLRRARDYIVEALQWVVDDGIAARVDVTVEWVRRGVLGAQIAISQANGAKLALRYSWAWE